MTSRFLVALAGLTCVTFAGAPASAQPGRRAAVVRLDVDSRVPEGSRLQMAEQLSQGLVLAGLQAIMGENVRAAVKRISGGDTCKTEDCFRDVAAALGVDYLVTATVSAKQRNYTIKVTLFAANGQRLGASTDTCELCGMQDVGEKMRKVALSTSLHIPVAAVPVTSLVSFESAPSGASVIVDGTPRGNTPVELDLMPGEHNLVLVAPGYRSGRRTIRSEAGREQLVSMDLAPEATPASHRTWKRLGWAALGLGAAAVAGGVVAFTMDRKSVPCAPGSAPGETCLRRTNALATGLLAGGATAAAAGGLVLYLSAHPASGTAEAGATSTALTFGLGVSGRF